MCALDTNVLVRLIVRDDPKQTAAAEAFIAQGVWTPILALAEAVWVLRAVYKRSPKELAGIVEMLLQHTRLTIQDADVAATALELFRSRPALGYSDCLILLMAHKAGHLPLGTFDRMLARSTSNKKLRVELLG